MLLQQRLQPSQPAAFSSPRVAPSPASCRGLVQVERWWIKGVSNTCDTAAPSRRLPHVQGDTAALLPTRARWRCRLYRAALSISPLLAFEVFTVRATAGHGLEQNAEGRGADAGETSQRALVLVAIEQTWSSPLGRRAGGRGGAERGALRGKPGPAAAPGLSAPFSATPGAVPASRPARISAPSRPPPKRPGGSRPPQRRPRARVMRRTAHEREAAEGPVRSRSRRRRRKTLTAAAALSVRPNGEGSRPAQPSPWWASSSAASRLGAGGPRPRLRGRGRRGLVVAGRVPGSRAGPGRPVRGRGVLGAAEGRREADTGRGSAGAGGRPAGSVRPRLGPGRLARAFRAGSGAFVRAEGCGSAGRRLGLGWKRGAERAGGDGPSGALLGAGRLGALSAVSTGGARVCWAQPKPGRVGEFRGDCFVLLAASCSCKRREGAPTYLAFCPHCFYLDSLGFAAGSHTGWLCPFHSGGVWNRNCCFCLLTVEMVMFPILSKEIRVSVLFITCRAMHPRGDVMAML